MNASPVRGSSECITTQYKKTCNKRCNGFIKNIMISVTKNSNMLLESEVVSVLETLVKATVNEMTKVMDTSVKPPQTNITADNYDSLDFTVSVQKVYEMTVFLAFCVCL